MSISVGDVGFGRMMLLHFGFVNAHEAVNPSRCA